MVILQLFTFMLKSKGGISFVGNHHGDLLRGYQHRQGRARRRPRGLKGRGKKKTPIVNSTEMRGY